MKKIKIKYDYDDLMLEIMIEEAKFKPVGIVQISHGMSENKERYKDFIKYLSSNGYTVVIHDHRGHGKSVLSDEEFGYFSSNKDILVDELYQVTNYIKEKYPNQKITLFSHSMGSLVARKYIQEHDDIIDELILCGAPTYNPFSNIGILLANIIGKLKGEKHRSKFLNNLVFGSYNSKNDVQNSWICSDKGVVQKYNESKYCGFIFTIDGFKMLFYLMKSVFNKELYKVKNKTLPIFLIGGSDDPVINGKKKFNHLSSFIKSLGYNNVHAKLYTGMRHEILNEKEKQEVYEDILEFLNKN